MIRPVPGAFDPSEHAVQTYFSPDCSALWLRLVKYLEEGTLVAEVWLWLLRKEHFARVASRSQPVFFSFPPHLPFTGLVLRPDSRTTVNVRTTVNSPRKLQRALRRCKAIRGTHPNMKALQEKVKLALANQKYYGQNLQSSKVKRAVVRKVARHLVTEGLVNLTSNDGSILPAPGQITPSLLSGNDTSADTTPMNIIAAKQVETVFLAAPTAKPPPLPGIDHTQEPIPATRKVINPTVPKKRSAEETEAVVAKKVKESDDRDPAYRVNLHRYHLNMDTDVERTERCSVYLTGTSVVGRIHFKHGRENKRTGARSISISAFVPDFDIDANMLISAFFGTHTTYHSEGTYFSRHYGVLPRELFLDAIMSGEVVTRRTKNRVTFARAKTIADAWGLTNYLQPLFDAITTKLFHA
ncbi:uncharacterized protein K452DRAFT_306568 [Aplosporella prunicola CBS 121167]|uniref:Uncharacterized protein n=1 Tax=Aplosporella prunicola CBS 121167 TaxID=1176127 RepID=A0A6A6BNG0_9PEZI|nr:uncharacterized protein K452DRAFT_306568 [Aplosporella prunicola CBS 121167]KAF2144805.1 hypothetical protein K452DRAFT_306568 [Aplosporella prunicola CBS 121167]